MGAIRGSAQLIRLHALVQDLEDLTPLVKTYGEGEKGRLILLYGANGLLQIAMNLGSAAKQMKVEPGTVIFLKP